jgi:hypothetical protein
MPARDRRLLFAAAVGMGALLLLAAFTGHADVLKFAGPFWLLTLPLVAGRYVGEDAFVQRLRRDRPARRRPLAPRALPKGSRRVAVLLPRGGGLMAEALAVRPPPLLPSTS